MLITAALVILSFARGLILYGGDVSILKTAIFSIVFLWGIMSFPMAGASGRGTPYMGRAMQMKLKLAAYLSKYALPPIVLGVFIWLTFTTWKRTDREYGLGVLLRGHVNSDVPAR
jgi:hypothetical protein